MQRIQVMSQGAVMQCEMPLLRKFLAKLVIDVVPAALASLMVGYLLTQYQFGHSPAPLAAEQAAPASAEMMQLVRDEHAVIVDYLKAQEAAEKNRYAADDNADAKAVADAKAAAATTLRRIGAVVVSPKPSPSRIKAPTVAPMYAAASPARAPMPVVQPESRDSVAPPAATAPESLLAKTIDIKDHVVHATLHAVSAIGGIPNWIASLGDRFGGGGGAGAAADTRQFSQSS
jgi:hypothetical protein